VCPVVLEVSSRFCGPPRQGHDAEAAVILVVGLHLPVRVDATDAEHVAVYVAPLERDPLLRP
jgi:hypothetical protein